MTRVNSTIEFPSASTSKTVGAPQLNAFDKAIKDAYERLARVINGSVSFGDGLNADNILGVWKTVATPGAPNTNFVVSHNLGYVPHGYLVMSKSAACDVYTGSVAATTSTITLRATVAGVTLVLFIL